MDVVKEKTMPREYVDRIYSSGDGGILVSNHYGDRVNPDETTITAYLKIDEDWLKERIDDRLSSRMSDTYSIPKERLIIGVGEEFTQEEINYLQGGAGVTLEPMDKRWFARLSHIIEGRVISRLLARFHPEMSGVLKGVTDLESLSLNALADYLEEKRLYNYSQRIRKVIERVEGLDQQEEKL